MSASLTRNCIYNSSRQLLQDYFRHVQGPSACGPQEPGQTQGQQEAGSKAGQVPAGESPAPPAPLQDLWEEGLGDTLWGQHL